MRILIALLPAGCGLLFGAGLAVSGMTDTRIVLGFLDVTGDWNPALLMMMCGALAVTIPCFWLAQKRSAPLFSSRFHIPENCRIESTPLVGSVVLGIGWGLYGYCPGHAIAAVLSLNWQPLIFIAAMAVGMLMERRLRA